MTFWASTAVSLLALVAIFSVSSARYPGYRRHGMTPLQPGEEERRKLIDLTTENWHEEAAKADFLFVNYTPWCQHCQDLETEWNQLWYTYDDKLYSIGQVDCEAEATLCRKHKITGYPALIVYKDGEAISGDFGGGRSAQIMDFWVRTQINLYNQKDEIARSLKEQEFSGGETDKRGAASDKDVPQHDHRKEIQEHFRKKEEAEKEQKDKEERLERIKAREERRAERKRREQEEL